MNKVYVVGSILNDIKQFEDFFFNCDSNDMIYVLGNFSICSSQQKSQVSYIYFYNLIKQKELNKDIKIPFIKLLKGKNESEINFKKSDLTPLCLSSAYKFIINMNLSKWFDPNLQPASIDEINHFINNLNPVFETKEYILLSGFYDVNKSTNEQINDIYKNLDDGLLFGNPGKITLEYYKFCKNNKLRLWTKKSIQQYNIAPINYYHNYKSIDEYNIDIKNKLNKIIICGYWYDPLFKKDLNINKWSYLWMIDGGINRFYNNEDEWFYFKPEEQKFNVIEISDINDIKVVNKI